MAYSMDSSHSYQDALRIIKNNALGDENKRIAVLGSFDTWSYMHSICVEIAKLGGTAITSKYLYINFSGSKFQYYRTQRDIDQQKTMNDFLKENVIGEAKKAIIVYSVPAAHYNEAEWCNQKCEKDPTFTALGICFARDISKDTYCKSLTINNDLNYAYCEGIGTAWECIDKPDCPFKNQGIAKNQIEYFLNNKNKMKLIAIEKVENMGEIINDFLNDNLVTPSNSPYVYEFRIDLNSDQKSKLDEKVNKLLFSSEEKKYTDYKQIDYYYKPFSQTIDQWLEKNRTLRIREDKVPLNEKQIDSEISINQGITSIYSSEIIPTVDGFFSIDPFGSLKWYTGEKDRSEKLLTDHAMDFFLKVIKTGTVWDIFYENIAFKAYIEQIEVEQNKTQSLTYGYSVEIEIWAKEPIMTDELVKKRKTILKLLELEGLPTKIVPVQSFIYSWSKSQTFPVLK